jgi:hypothetical protein
MKRMKIWVALLMGFSISGQLLFGMEEDKDIATKKMEILTWLQALGADYTSFEAYKRDQKSSREEKQLEHIFNRHTTVKMSHHFYQKSSIEDFIWCCFQKYVTCAEKNNNVSFYDAVESIPDIVNKEHAEQIIAEHKKQWAGVDGAKKQRILLDTVCEMPLLKIKTNELVGLLQ